jgi:uncharacterized protein
MPTKASMQDFVIHMLKKNIPSSYAYHNYAHTLYVQDKAMEIGRHEQLNAQDMKLLNTAALWHDTGYIHTYKGHEEESCTMTKEYLPGYGFNEADISSICGMIMATKVPQSPTNLLEKIIADADLAYLGTIGAAEKAENLFKEMRSVNPSLTLSEWNSTQVSFLESHKYFTKYYKEKKEPVKNIYLAELKKAAGKT